MYFDSITILVWVVTATYENLCFCAVALVESNARPMGVQLVSSEKTNKTSSPMDLVELAKQVQKVSSCLFVMIHSVVVMLWFIDQKIISLSFMRVVPNAFNERQKPGKAGNKDIELTEFYLEGTCTAFCSLFFSLSLTCPYFSSSLRRKHMSVNSKY